MLANYICRISLLKDTHVLLTYTHSHAHWCVCVYVYYITLTLPYYTSLFYATIQYNIILHCIIPTFLYYVAYELHSNVSACGRWPDTILLLEFTEVNHEAKHKCRLTGRGFQGQFPWSALSGHSMSVSSHAGPPFLAVWGTGFQIMPRGMSEPCRESLKSKQIVEKNI